MGRIGTDTTRSFHPARSSGLPVGLGGCCMASIQDDAPDVSADTALRIADVAGAT